LRTDIGVINEYVTRLLHFNSPTAPSLDGG
jgi:hypothetical protein